MTDDRFLIELDVWLREGEVVPPEVRLSSARAMAGVARTRQLGRWWPPERLAPTARPVPMRSGARASAQLPSRPAAEPLSVLAATRVAAIAVMLVIVAGSLLVGRALLPEPVEPAPANILASPSPSPSPSGSAAASLGPHPDGSPEALPAFAADSTLAATNVLYELEPLSQPTSLAQGPDKTSLYLDGATGESVEIARDGYRRIVAAPGHAVPTAAMSGQSAIGRGGRFIVIVDEAGLIWLEAEGYGDVPYPAMSGGDDPLRPAPAVTVPLAVPFETISRTSNRFDLYAVDAESGDVVVYDYQYERDHSETLRIERSGLPPAVGIHADPVVFVLTEAGVERYEDGRRTESFALETPPGDPPVYRLLDGIGRGGQGQLWLYDAAGSRMVVFDKASGAYLDSWAPGPAGPPMVDLGGMYVEGNGTGQVATIMWITPSALVRGALSDPTLVAPRARAGTHDGRLDPSGREPGPRALDWSDGSVRLEADRVRLQTNDRVFRTAGETVVDTDPYGDDIDLDLTWFEHGVRQHLYLQLRSDETHWWIREIWASDGTRDAQGLYFEDLAPLTRTLKGRSLEGDLRLPNTSADRPRLQADGSAELVIDGLRLTAFRPQDQSAPLTGCDYLDLEGRRITDGTSGGKSIDVPQPADIKALSPREAEALLQERGVCYRFSYAWRRPDFKDERLNQPPDLWFDELRCSAPEHGRITQVHLIADDAGEPYQHFIRVDVKDDELRDLPMPPPYGTDCEPLAPG